MVQFNLNHPQKLFSQVTNGMFISLKWLNFIYYLQMLVILWNVY